MCVDTSSVCLLKEELAMFEDFAEEDNNVLNPVKSKELYAKLSQLQSDIMSSEPTLVLVGPAVLCGLSNAMHCK